MKNLNLFISLLLVVSVFGMWNFTKEAETDSKTKLESDFDTNSAFKKYNVKYNDSFELVPKVDVYKEDYFIKEKSVFPFIYKKSKHIKTKYIIKESNCGC